MTIRNLTLLVITAWVSVSLVSGLDLAVSTGGDQGSSSMGVSYGATTLDKVNQEIKINVDESTLSNRIYGTGPLKGSKLSQSDNKGNKATVYREVIGSPVITSYDYEWCTAIDDAGVYAHENLHVVNALEINAYAEGKNEEGDKALASANLVSPLSSSAYINEDFTSYASLDRVEASQVGMASVTGPLSSITLSGEYHNEEGDSASIETRTDGDGTVYIDLSGEARKNSVIANQMGSSTADSIKAWAVAEKKEDQMKSKSEVFIESGSLIGYTNKAYAVDNYVLTSQNAIEGSGQDVTFSSNAENNKKEDKGEKTSVSVHVDEGTVKTISQQSIVTADLLTGEQTIEDSYGSLAEINSYVRNEALGYHRKTIGDGWVDEPVNLGEGYFTALKKNYDHFGQTIVTSNANKDDVTIEATIEATGFGENTALILDPRRYEFEVNKNNLITDEDLGYDYKGVPMREPIMEKLSGAGYAVTYYSDSAVTPDKVYEMDEYKVSAIFTHSHDSESLLLSKSAAGSTEEGDEPYLTVHASDLEEAWDKKNGMMIIVGCNAFKETGEGTLAYAARNAEVSGGPDDYWDAGFGREFLVHYFANMAEGQSASEANKPRMGPLFTEDGEYKTETAYLDNGKEYHPIIKDWIQLKLLPLPTQTILYSTDFENYDVGTLPPELKILYSGKGTQYQIVTSDASNSGTQSLQAWGRYNWGASVIYPLTQPESGRIGYEVYIKANPTEEASAQYLNTDATTWGWGWAGVGFGRDGYIRAPATSTPTGYQKLQPDGDQWYKVKSEMDVVTGETWIWLDDELVVDGKTPAEMGKTSPDAYKGINAITFTDSSWYENPSSPTYYDDFTVYTATPAPADNWYL